MRGWRNDSDIARLRPSQLGSRIELHSQAERIKPGPRFEVEAGTLTRHDLLSLDIALNLWTMAA